MKKYIIEKFTQPIIKTLEEVKPLNVEYFSYGEEENVGIAIVLKAEIDKSNKNIIKVTYAREDGSTFVGYAYINRGGDKFEIVGKAKEIIKEKVMDK